MQTSVLRTVSEKTAALPDVTQNIEDDAYPLLIYADKTVWNDDICGNMSVKLIPDGLSADFVTFYYEYRKTSEQRWIKVLPTLNSQKNTLGYNVVLSISLVEYPSITADVPFNIKVLTCEIKDLSGSLEG